MRMRILKNKYALSFSAEIFFSHQDCNSFHQKMVAPYQNSGLLKKKLKKNFFWNFLKFFIFFKSPGRKMSGFRTVRILTICRTSGPDVMSGWALPLWPLLNTHPSLLFNVVINTPLEFFEFMMKQMESIAVMEIFPFLLFLKSISQFKESKWLFTNYVGKIR